VCAKSQPPTAALDALVCGYAPRWRAQKKFAIMNQGFSDDSMSGEGLKTLLLAGCVKQYAAWADFCFDWEAALAIEPSIKYFKMREARLLIKEFSGWKGRDRDDKIRSLAKVINRYQPNVIYTWISQKEFDDTVEPIIPYMMRHPYILLFYALLIKAAQWQYDVGEHVPTDFIFDEQGSVGEEAVAFYSYYKRMQRPEIAALMGSTPIFRDDKLVLPLQAADVVAWHKRRRIDNPGELVSQLPTAVLEDLNYAEVHLNRDFLTIIATEAAKLPGIPFVHEKPKGYVPGKLPEDIYGPKR
jgi:hypothetical protein